MHRRNLFNLSYTKLYNISLCCTNFHIIIRAFVPTSICCVHLSRGLSTSSVEASPPTLVDKKNADSKMVPIFSRKCGAVTFFKMNFCRGGMIYTDVYTDIWITNETNARSFGMSLTMWCLEICILSSSSLSTADSTNILVWRHKAIFPIFPKSYASCLTFTNLSIVQAAPSIFFTKSFNIWASFHLARGLHRIRHIYWRHLMTQRSAPGDIQMERVTPNRL